MQFVRITESYSTLEGFFTSLAEVCDRLVVFEHDSSTRCHVHFYTSGCTIKPDAMKTRIKKHLHVSTYAKDKWSFKTASDDGCIVYMSKGCLEPSFVKGFTPDEINAYRARWVERTPETSAEVKSKSTVTQYDMAMEVVDMIQSTNTISDILKYLDSDNPLLHGKSHEELYTLCVKYAIKVCHKHRKGFDEFSLRKIVHPAYSKFRGGREHLVSRIVNSFFLR